MAVGVSNVEVRISSLAFADLLRHLDAPRSKGCAQAFSGVGVLSDVIQLAFLFWRVSKQRDVLVFVDFDERDPNRSIVALQIVRLCVVPRQN
jgi:hypothetical protein